MNPLEGMVSRMEQAHAVEGHQRGFAVYADEVSYEQYLAPDKSIANLLDRSVMAANNHA